MIDHWVQQEWRNLCVRLMQCAEKLKSSKPRIIAKQILQEARSFSQLQPPDRYAELLVRVREAARIAADWKLRQSMPNKQHVVNCSLFDSVDETLDESFPASDPPSWTGATI